MTLRGFGQYGSLMKITSNDDGSEDDTKEEVQEPETPNDYHHENVFQV